MRSGRLPKPPKSMPVATQRALLTYDRAQRAKTVGRQRYWPHVLLSYLDAMTPLELAAYYHRLVVMRKRDETQALPQRYRKSHRSVR